MQFTSAEASKLLRRLTEEHENLRRRERTLDTFGAFANEDPDSIRPEYNYSDYQAQMELIEKKIRTIKHAVNTFNVTTVLPDTDDLTIDQALVYLPQLTARKQKLQLMASRLEKMRVESDRSTTAAVSEFVYTNYKVEEARADYEKTAAEIASLQTKLDVVNNTKTFEIVLE